MPEPGTFATWDFLPEHSFGMPRWDTILYAKKTNERTNLQPGAKQKQPQYTPRNNMADLPEENIQATMMAILKNIKRSLLNVEESTNRLCSSTRSPQGGLDLECPILENDCIGGGDE